MKFRVLFGSHENNPILGALSNDSCSQNSYFIYTLTRIALNLTAQNLRNRHIFGVFCAKTIEYRPLIPLLTHIFDRNMLACAVHAKKSFVVSDHVRPNKQAVICYFCFVTSIYYARKHPRYVRNSYVRSWNCFRD